MGRVAQHRRATFVNKQTLKIVAEDIVVKKGTLKALHTSLC